MLLDYPQNRNRQKYTTPPNDDWSELRRGNKWSFWLLILLPSPSANTTVCSRYSLPMQADKREGENQIRKKRGPLPICSLYSILNCTANYFHLCIPKIDLGTSNIN